MDEAVLFLLVWSIVFVAWYVAEMEAPYKEPVKSRRPQSPKKAAVSALKVATVVSVLAGLYWKFFYNS
jgi:hypothetical protein